jgi:hypothetical protein
MVIIPAGAVGRLPSVAVIRTLQHSMKFPSKSVPAVQTTCLPVPTAIPDPTDPARLVAGTEYVSPPSAETRTSIVYESPSASAKL